jgi:hypothetical protein
MSAGESVIHVETTLHYHGDVQLCVVTIRDRVSHREHNYTIEARHVRALLNTLEHAVLERPRLFPDTRTMFSEPIVDRTPGRAS